MSLRIRRTRFTLVELLVVIAIITVLAALLLPSLAQARRQVMSTVCQSHLRQQAIACTMYATDGEGWLPYNGRWSSQWMVDTHEYVGDSRPGMTNQINRPGSPEKYFEIFRCPTTYTWKRRDYYNGCYGYNWLATSEAPTSNVIQKYKYVRSLDGQISPERTLMIMDNWLCTPGFTEMTQSVTPTGDEARVRYHQRYSLNVVFMAGNAANLRKGERKDILFGVSKIDGLPATGW